MSPGLALDADQGGSSRGLIATVVVDHGAIRHRWKREIVFNVVSCFVHVVLHVVAHPVDQDVLRGIDNFFDECKSGVEFFLWSWRVVDNCVLMLRKSDSTTFFSWRYSFFSLKS